MSSRAQRPYLQSSWTTPRVLGQISRVSSRTLLDSQSSDIQSSWLGISRLKIILRSSGQVSSRAQRPYLQSSWTTPRVLGYISRVLSPFLCPESIILHNNHHLDKSCPSVARLKTVVIYRLQVIPRQVQVGKNVVQVHCLDIRIQSYRPGNLDDATKSRPSDPGGAPQE